MKRALQYVVNNEKTVHILTAVGFLGCALILMVFPSFFDMRTTMSALFFLLGTKTLANIIIDSHHEETYFKQSDSSTKK